MRGLRGAGRGKSEGYGEGGGGLGRGEGTYASMTWTTPLETRMSGVMTLALLTKTVPLERVMVRGLPFRAVSLVPFLRFEL